MANQVVRGYDFFVDRVPKLPIALIIPAEQDAVVGSIVKLDGSASIDAEGLPLTFAWRFVQVPIGSQVERFGFTLLENDSSVVSFAPDVSGHYQVELVVSNGKIESNPALGDVDVRIILVPHHKGIIPDASFIWNFLSDFWPLVEDRYKFEVFWSAGIQIVANELLRALQIDYNKSINDIQELFQRNWLAYSPHLEINADDVSFFLADDQAGSDASTLLVDPDTGVTATVQPDYSSLVLVPKEEGDFAKTGYGQTIATGRLLRVSNRSFTLSRATSLSKSVNYGLDGHTEATPGSPTPNQPLHFFGSGFTADLAGATLKILSVANKGTYLISSVVDSQTLLVNTTTGGTPSWTEVTGLTYSILPARPNYNAFFADQVQIPTKLAGQPWRFSSTLVSSSVDFESQGVAPGDVLVAEIKRSDTLVSAEIDLQVVSVDRNRVGFVFNVDDLKDGVAAAGISNSVQRALADSLRVPGLIDVVGGGFLYLDAAKLIRDTVTSIAFKRKYFETKLTATTAINLGPFSVTLRLIKVIRNKFLPVDPKVVSIPVLQEYIKEPDIVENNGVLSHVTRDGLVAIDHKPYVLLENFDFVLDDEGTIRGACDLRSGEDVIFIPFGDLIDRSVDEGDTITVTAGAFVEVFTILKVIDAERVQVFPAAGVDAIEATFKLTRRVSGRHIRFVRDIFTKNRPAPKRLWAEVSFLDNNDAVEANFGVLVGVTREDLEKQEAEVPYKSAVAGLMYALTLGPSVTRLQLAAQILFGLPFTQTRGRIVEINQDYRLRPDGSRLLGRILIDELDDKDQPTGLTNIYFFPQGRQLKILEENAFITGICDTIEDSDNVVIHLGDLTQRNISPGDSIGIAGSSYTIVNVISDEVLRVTPPVTSTNTGISFLLERQISEIFVPATPDSAGLGINEDTGEEFKLGDVVEAFTPLSKGVILDEYITKPDWFRSLIDQLGSNRPELEKYHSFRVLANADTVTAADVDLVARFLKIAKPSHTKLQVGIFRPLEDFVIVKDNFIFALGRPPIFFENISYSLPVASKFDRGTGDESVITVEGTISSRYLSGDDLITTQDSNSVQSPSGGFVTARLGFNEDHDSPFIQAGDLLVIKRNDQGQLSPNVGKYTIIQVTDDQNLVLDLSGGTVFQTLGNQQFAIYRPIKNPIFIGTGQLILGNDTIAISPGTTANTFSAGVAVGDVLILTNPINPAVAPSRRYLITNIDLLTNTLTMNVPFEEATGLYSVTIIREGLVPKYFFSKASDLPHVATLVSGNNKVTFTAASSDKLALAMMQPGDVIVYPDGTNIYSLIVVDWDVTTLTATIAGDSPVSGSGVSVRLVRPSRAATVISDDLLDRMPYDILEMDLKSSAQDLVTTSGSTTVSTVSGEDFIDLGIIPGDYLIVREGADSTRDVGHGPGIYTIVRVISNTQLELATAMTVTQASPGILYGLRRRRANEG